MIKRRSWRWIGSSWLVAVGLCAVLWSCKRRESEKAPRIEPAPASSSSASAAPVASGRPPSLELGPAEGASRQEAVLALLTGQVEANRLPEVSTEPGEKIDPLLRDALAPRKKPPHVRLQTPTVNGIAGEIVERLTTLNLPRFQACYERGLSRNPYLQGKVSTRVMIAEDGRVSETDSGGSDLPDSAVVACISDVFRTLVFPKTDVAKAVAVVPISFEPPDGK